ncbi:MAG: sugar phosphate isomerase/epimerase [Chloroflexi bacterium]|nr:sugar phosphate isomerase/epimerase [Chloroflexota bacterium]
MKFGVNVWVWTAPITTDELKKLAPKVADMGFEYIEIGLESIDDLDHDEGAAIIADYGLGVSTCAAVGEDRDLIHPDPAIRANGNDYMRQAIVATQTLGGTNLVGPIYSAVGRTWQMTAEERARDTDLLVATLTDLSAYAADHGVTLCVEPLNRFETSFINLASQAIEVVDRVDHPACQILLDTFHMNIEEKSIGDAIRAAGPRLKHVHSCGSDRGSPGSGTIDWDEVATALRDVNYDGPVVIESFTTKVKSIAKAAAIWRPLAPTQDALAVDGLKFLKQLL